MPPTQIQSLKLIKKNRLRGDPETELQLQQYEIRRLQQRLDDMDKAYQKLMRSHEAALKDIIALKKLGNQLHRSSKRALSSNVSEPNVQRARTAEQPKST